MVATRTSARTGFFTPVSITVHTVAGAAEMMVETRKQFATEISIDYSNAGSRQRKGVSPTEENLFGWGDGSATRFFP